MDQPKKTFRFVVNIDIQAATLAEAYAALAENMDSSANPCVGWESSDEWYDGLTDEAGDPDELQQVAEAYFNG